MPLHQPEMLATVLDDATLDAIEINVPFIPLGRIIAKDVSIDDYMEKYAQFHCEYVEGYVVYMAPSSIGHVDLFQYLLYLFGAFFELRPIGRVISQPFVMKTPAFPDRRREPDLFVVLKNNPHRLEKTFMDDPADSVIEIVSKESFARDTSEKFLDYQDGGVEEYWLLDQLRQDARFYRPNADGIYVPQSIDANGVYQTVSLPTLKLHVPTLWQDTLPGPIATANAVRAMLTQSE